jgi:hypothetical protein
VKSDTTIATKPEKRMIFPLLSLFFHDKFYLYAYIYIVSVRESPFSGFMVRQAHHERFFLLKNAIPARTEPGRSMSGRQSRTEIN